MNELQKKKKRDPYLWSLGVFCESFPWFRLAWTASAGKVAFSVQNFMKSSVDLYNDRLMEAF